MRGTARRSGARPVRPESPRDQHIKSPLLPLLMLVVEQRSHFEPLVSVHGYNYSSHKDFPRLSRLLEGCTPDAIALAASSNVDDDTVACCENNMLFSTEEHLMNSVPYEHRITTMRADPNAILGGSAHTLISDFWDDCQASKKKSG